MSETIGHYEILGLLGTGSSGTVYRARDTRVGRTVAIRVMGDPSGDPARRSRFIEAVRPFTEISHPNVATLFELGEHRGCAYLAYEFVPGERLEALAAGHPLNLRRAIDICVQVADALADIHSYGVSHGALTLSSVVVTPKGRVKVLNVGLSAWQGDGQQSDVFALGVILYELLTGRPPFEAANRSDTGAGAAQPTPPPPSRVKSDVPPEVDAIVAKALAKGDLRYSSVPAMAADLRAAASIVLQREASAEIAQAVPAVSSRARLWRSVLLLGLLTLAIAVAGFTWRETLAQTWRSWFGAPFPPVIAVMPFSVGGGDPPRTSVGPGFAEELARQLAQIPGIIVKGRTTIRTLGGKPTVAVAADTRASAVITGSVAPGPGGWSEIDLRVELVDGSNGRGVWNQHYAGSTTDAFAILARAAGDIAARLDVPQREKRSATENRAVLRLVNADALDSYFQGRDALADGDTGRAATLFQAAVETDPSFIEAQASLVESLYLGAVFDARVSYAGVQAHMRQLAEAASAADPDLAVVQLATGLAGGTFADSFTHLRRAIELDRSFGAAYLAVADTLRDIDPARAIRFVRKAAELDPGQPLTVYQEAAATLSIGERADTLAVVARGQALAPGAAWWDALRQRAQLAGTRAAPGAVTTRSVSDFAPGAVMRALTSLADNRPDDAANILAIITRVNPEFCEARALLAGVKHLSGDRTEAQQLVIDIYRAAQSAPDPAAWTRCAAMAAAGVGDGTRAAFWIGRAAADEHALRLWGATSAVLSPQPAIRQKLFPWNRVSGTAQFNAAVAGMESALQRARAAAAQQLAGIE